MTTTKINKLIKTNAGMRPEYDFSGGVRRRHYKSRLRGYIVKIHKPDGNMQVTKIERL